MEFFPVSYFQTALPTARGVSAKNDVPKRKDNGGGENVPVQNFERTRIEKDTKITTSSQRVRMIHAQDALFPLESTSIQHLCFLEDQRSVAAKVVAVRTEHQRSVVAEVAVVVVTLTKRKNLKVVRRNEVPSGTYLCIVQINLQFDEQKWTDFIFLQHSMHRHYHHLILSVPCTTISDTIDLSSNSLTAILVALLTRAEVGIAP